MKIKMQKICTLKIKSLDNNLLYYTSLIFINLFRKSTLPLSYYQKNYMFVKRKKIKEYFFYTSPHYLDRKNTLET